MPACRLIRNHRAKKYGLQWGVDVCIVCGSCVLNWLFGGQGRGLWRPAQDYAQGGLDKLCGCVIMIICL